MMKKIEQLENKMENEISLSLSIFRVNFLLSDIREEKRKYFGNQQEGFILFKLI